MKTSHFLLGAMAGCLLSCATSAAEPWNLRCSFDNRVTFLRGEQEIGSITPIFFLKGWRGGHIVAWDYDLNRKDFGESTGGLDDVHFSAALTTEEAGENGARLRYLLKVNEAAELNTLAVTLNISNRFLFGGSFQIGDGPEQPFPVEKPADAALFSDVVSDVTLRTSEGMLAIHLPRPLRLLIQDNRTWKDDSVSFRIGFNTGNAETWEAGQTEDIELEFSSLDGLNLEKPSIYKLEQGEDWIPLDAPQDIVPGSALDFSVMGFCDGPAGKHGRVVAKNGHFEFEKLPGKPQRFYGINLVGSGQIITHEESETLAERLWRLGYNTVRFHHHDGPLSDRAKDGVTELNNDTMDKLDYLFAALKKRGIYCTTDLYVSRRIRNKAIWPDMEGELDMHVYKNLLPFNEKVWENWKAFSRNFLLHVNPYTGMSYAEDPAMAWICMINEATFDFWRVDQMDDLSREEWRKGWNEWLLRKYGSWQERNRAHGVERPEVIDPLPKSYEMSEAERTDFGMFILETERRLYADMKAFVQGELGCKALLTSMNYCGLEPFSSLAREDFDYVDSHFYIDHPRFPVKNWSLPSSCPNRSVVRDGKLGGSHEAVCRIFGKPFAITEFNYSAPGQYRGIGGILTGCVGALQDWSGVWRFAYSHSSHCLFKQAPLDYFDMSRDPLSQAAERASLCLFLREDMAPLKDSIAMTLKRSGDGHGIKRNPVGELEAMVLQTQIGIAFEDTAAERSLSVAMTDDAPHGQTHVGLDKDMMDSPIALMAKPAALQTPDGQLKLMPTQDTMVLNTARTAGGYAPAGGKIHTDVIDIEILTTNATVWASSLDSLPLKESRHMLLTHLTDLQNSEMVYAEPQRRLLLRWGELPYLVRNGQARLRLKVPAGQKATVWALKTSGERMETLPVTETDGGVEVLLSVKGENGARMLYEVQLEAR